MNEGKNWKYGVDLTIRVFSIVFMFASAYRQGSLCSSKPLFSREKQAIRSRLWAATATGGYAWYDPCKTLPKGISLASYRPRHVVLIIRYCCGFALQLGGKASRQGNCGLSSLSAKTISFHSIFIFLFFSCLLLTPGGAADYFLLHSLGHLLFPLLALRLLDSLFVLLRGDVSITLNNKSS